MFDGVLCRPQSVCGDGGVAVREKGPILEPEKCTDDTVIFSDAESRP